MNKLIRFYLELDEMIYCFWESLSFCIRSFFKLYAKSRAMRKAGEEVGAVMVLGPKDKMGEILNYINKGNGAHKQGDQ